MNCFIVISDPMRYDIRRAKLSNRSFSIIFLTDAPLFELESRCINYLGDYSKNLQSNFPDDSYVHNATACSVNNN